MEAIFEWLKNSGGAGFIALTFLLLYLDERKKHRKDEKENNIILVALSREVISAIKENTSTVQRLVDKP